MGYNNFTSVNITHLSPVIFQISFLASSMLGNDNEQDVLVERLNVLLFNINYNF